MVGYTSPGNPCVFLASPNTGTWIVVIVAGLPLIVLLVISAVLFFFIKMAHSDANFRDEVLKIKSSANYTWYWLVIHIWLTRFKLKRLIPYFILAVVSVAGIFTVLELLIKLQRSLLEISAAWVVSAVAAVVIVYYLSNRSRAGSLYSYVVIGFALLTLVLTLTSAIFFLLGRGVGFLSGLTDIFGVWIEYLGSQTFALLVLLVIEIFILLHHWEEHGKRGRESSVFQALRLLISDLTSQNAIFGALRDDEQTAAMKDFHKKFCLTFATLLREREIEGLDISIMLFDQAEQRLSIVSIDPDDPPRVVEDFRPGPGVGAAGNAFKTGNLIYLPKIKYGHGIEYEICDPVPRASAASSQQRGAGLAAKAGPQIRLIPRAYVPVTKEPFKSMVSVPIRDTHNTVIGVVNFSSPKANAFSTSEFHLLSLSGRILGFLYR